MQTLPPKQVDTTEPASPAALDDVVELPNLTVRIDPAASELPSTEAIVNLLSDILRAYPLESHSEAALFASTEASLDWIIETTQSNNCLDFEDTDRYRDIGGWGDECGFIMRVDATSLDCRAEPSCWTVLNIAAHEFFHVIAAQRLGSCVCEPRLYGNKIANWYNEGIADYVGYSAVRGPGTDTLDAAISENLANAKLPEVSVNLDELDTLWSRSQGEPWFAVLYNRSFMVTAFLIQQFGEEAVLNSFFDNVVDAGNFVEGFQATFGKSVDEFSDDFDEWISSL